MNSKAKGNRGERELVELLTAHGIQAHRNDQRYIGGKGNPDVAAEIEGISFHVEVKRQQQLNIHEAIRQAVADAVDAVPVVVHRRNREAWLVTIKLSDVLRIIEEVQQ